jgi:Phosphotransferase system cellobiose-specific component IIC
MILRLAGGDGNALFGLVGFVAGILTGTIFLKKGYTLKRSYKMPKLEGGIYPAFQIVMLLLLVAAPAFIHFTEPEGGPGAKHAAIIIALAAGIIVGILAQRTRLCMVGGIRDAVLFKEYKLLFGFAAILVTALVMNLILGAVTGTSYFNPGFAGQPIRTYRRTVERTWHVSGRAWMYSPPWMPASSADLAGEGTPDQLYLFSG